MHGPDPLHLAAVFGLHPNTAIRYANAARHSRRQPPNSTIPEFTTNPRVSPLPRARVTLGFRPKNLQFR